MKYIARSIEPVVLRAAGEFPVVMLTGPRQSGKTTLLKQLFHPRLTYVSLELSDVLAAAHSDPRGFLKMYPPPVVFDEIQHAPGLMPYIKEHVDAHRDEAGQFILTGSQNIMLFRKVTESLAGRVAVLRLLPLSIRETLGLPDAPLPWEKEAAGEMKGLAHRPLWESFLRGGYPELVANPRRDAALWQGSYIQTYLERDIRSLRQIGDLTQFQSFLRALAARSAQLFNLSEMARDLGLAVNTIKSWLSILEATYQVFILRPYFANLTKRLVKTPKVYFADVGTLCHLVGLKDAEHAMAGPMAGAIFETAVVNEIIRTITHRGEEPQVYFWRTSSGREVDIVVDNGGRLIPVEVKVSATPHPSMAKGIEVFQKDFSGSAGKGYVIHPGESALPLSPGVVAWPFAGL